MSTQVTLNISNITNNGVPCKDPVILILGTTGEIAFPCGDKVDKYGNIKLTLPTSEFANNCVKAIIKCDSCGNCPEEEVDICLCETGADCGQCEQCIDGVCVSKCKDGEKCLDNTCVECVNNTECPPGFICINGTCVCLGKINDRGECVECLGDNDCSVCATCSGGKCVEKECQNNLICIGGDCSCPKGTKYDLETNSCIPTGCDNDSQCGECEICVAGNCQPVVCPEGYKCVGGECVYWPCTNVTCSNGADCGEDCGCLNGECVPCYILECSGECAEALGCKCNVDTQKCEPVDNCYDYCDGETPCLNQNCTCYNNTCVSCENFPCDPNDCDSRDNCGCSGGNCEGGNGCKDKLEIKKDCGTNKTDCKLTAKLTLEKPCKCDDIRFETSNTFTCTAQQSTAKLVVELFKGKVPYDNFNDITIGDNEFVEGIISTKITHYNTKGVVIDLPVTKVNDKTIVFNSVQEIVLDANTHFKTSYLDNNDTKGTKVKVEIIAKNIKIPNNNCINYNNETVIAEYELDFRNAVFNSFADSSQICAVLNTSFDLQKAYLNDKISVKKPLFIWSKSASDFPNTQYVSDGTYENKGWFRKEYGTKTSTGWEDVLYSIDQGLVNNYNYVVKVDCGCTKLAVHNALDFCCLDDVIPVLENCNTKLKLPSFKVCEINGKIEEGGIADFNKAYYSLLIVHSDRTLVSKDITFNTDNVTSLPINYEDASKGRITALRLRRYFKGGLLKDAECFKYLKIDDVSIPEIVYNTECKVAEFKYNITLNQVLSGLKILSASFIKSTSGKSGLEVSYAQSIIMGNDSQKSITIPIKNGNTGFLDLSTDKLFMVVKFEGGCSERYLLPTCEAEITIKAVPDIYSGITCIPSTNGPSIEVSVVGFTDAVQYSLNNGTYQVSNIFTNVEPGTYNVKAKDTIDGVETILEDSITIEPKMDTEVVFNPTALCAGQSATLTISGEPNSSFTIKNPNGTTLTANAVTNAQGIYNYPNITLAGEYTVTNNNSSNKYCSVNKKVTLESGGDVLNPTITFQEGTYCVGQPIPFRIFDNGKNRVYNLFSTNGSITSPIQAISNGFNGEYVPSSTTGSVTIQSSTSSCDTMSPVTVQTPTSGITISNGPVIGNPTTTCVSGLHTVSVNITGATSVTIGGVVVTPIGTTYTRTGITGVSSVDIVASNGSCSVTSVVTLQSCDCPQYDSVIEISAETCGQGSQTIFFTTYSPNLLGTDYQLQEFSLGQWWNVGGESGTFTDSPLPTFVVNNQINNPHSYRVVFTDGDCTEETNVVTTSAIQGPNIVITASQSNDVPINTPITLTAVGAPTTTYVWTGLGANGQTSNAVTVTFPNPGNYTYSVVATTGTCVNTVTYEVIVVNTCTNPPTISGITNLGNCQNPTANNPMGGSGTLTYAWSIDGGTTTLANTLVLAGNLIPPGFSGTLMFTITDSYGCSNVYTAAYTRCLNGCDCIYTLNVKDSATSLVDLTTYALEVLPTNINLVFQANKELTNSCTGVTTTTPINVLTHSILGATNIFSTGFNVTSMDVIDNGVATTIAIPSSYSGGNPRSNWALLADYLNNTLTGIGSFTYSSQGLKCQLGSTITKGFDFSGSFVSDGLTISYSRIVAGSSSIVTSDSVPCGYVTYSYRYSSSPLPSITVTSLSTVVVTGSYTMTRTTVESDNNTPLTCNGCN